MITKVSNKTAEAIILITFRVILVSAINLSRLAAVGVSEKLKSFGK
jgi:hypothetical protein